METHKTGTDVATPYLAFGQLLVDLRQKAGISRQSEFAGRIKTTQQTVSRWEAGTSRPRDKQMPLIAAVLNTGVDDLLAAAGYSRKTAIATFDQPFPVDALTPESFERFCQDFLQSVFPEADVHRAGETGHTQEGTDIIARFPDGSTFSFQCKRIQEFGPQKVHTAVAEHTIPANKKFLLLSRVASPQSRTAIGQHPDWDIWDKEDISLKIRRLPKVDQIRLVDIFFKGQRFALLGETEASPWETTKDFFAAFENKSGVFNHVWGLVGRTETLAALAGALANDDVRAIFLVGAGGSGKSRVLKQAIEKYESARKDVTVRFLSRTSEVTKASLEELGSKPALLIVDDAHDRNDLGLLFQHVGGATNNTKLLLSFRPYGLDHIKAQASGFSLVGSSVAEVKLVPLTLEESEKLAIQVLKTYSAPLGSAKDIARLTRDCPLATVVGAQIVAKERLHFDLAKNEGSFRQTLFGRFEDVIAGDIGNKADVESTKKTLKILALLQPFHPEDAGVLKVIEKVEGIAPHETNRLVKLLTDAGILFKRGARYRLSPDVLADYIVEANCIGAEGKSTGYAELVFDAIEVGQIENFLLNLGKLDWVRSSGDPTNSQLLDGVWKHLKPSNEYSDPFIRAVSSVAYYQPIRALEFAEQLMREGKYLNQLSPLLKYAGYNLVHLPRACEDLWQLGKDDKRALHSHPDHPIRVLAELCEVQPGKPFEYNEAVVEFGLGLIGDTASWTHAYSPLDILAPIFSTEGHTTSSKNHTISFNPFTVHASFIAPLRKKVVDAMISLLSNPDVKIAIRAARKIGDALRYPIGMFDLKVSNEIRDQWTAVFVETLEAIEQAIRTRPIDPLVLFAVSGSISWHANYAKGETSVVAKRIRSKHPKSLEFRVLTTLIDGHGSELRRMDRKKHEAEWNDYVAKLTADLLKTYPDSEKLRAFIAANLLRLQTDDPEKSASPYVLYHNLLQASPKFAKATAEDALAHQDSSTARFASSAISVLWNIDPAEGRRLIARYMQSGRSDLFLSVAQALGSLDYKSGRHGDEEISTLRSLLATDHDWVIDAAIHAVRSLAQADADVALNLALTTNLGTSNRRADELLCIFTWGNLIPFNRLSKEDVQGILEKLMEVPKLDGHWLETFLASTSQKFASITAGFFMRRVDRAAQANNWEYRPCNNGPYGHIPLLFKEAPEYGTLLAEVVRWLKSAKYDDDRQVLFKYRSRELFETIFGSFDEEVTRFLAEWAKVANEEDFQLIANILGEASETLVFDQQGFVVGLLEQAKIVGAETLKNVSSSLFSAAVGGMRQGVPGEPFPRDIKMKADAEAVLKTLSRFSPAYELYDAIAKSADVEIKRQSREKEAFED